MKQVFWIMNRKLNTVEILTGFRFWEEVQWAFRCGFRMSDGNAADAIGRTKDMDEFTRKAAYGGTTILNA